MSRKQFYFLRIIDIKEQVADFEINLTKKEAELILNRWKILSTIPEYCLLYAPLQKNKELTFSTTYSAYIQFSKNVMYEIFMLEKKELTNNENGSQGSK